MNMFNKVRNVNYKLRFRQDYILQINNTKPDDCGQMTGSVLLFITNTISHHVSSQRCASAQSAHISQAENHKEKETTEKINTANYKYDIQITLESILNYLRLKQMFLAVQSEEGCSLWAGSCSSGSSFESSLPCSACMPVKYTQGG